MHVVRSADRRVTTTPNGTMTTLASPTLGEARSSVWLVEMGPGAQGPEHSFVDEVVWAIIAGEASVTCDGSETTLDAGDTAVLPASAMRRICAGDAGFSAVVTTPAPGTVTRGDGEVVGVPEWVA